MKDNLSNKIIHICFACSDAYAPYLAVTLLSLFDKLNEKSSIKIYILTEDFSEESKLKINQLKKTKYFDIEYIYLQDTDFTFLTNDINCPKHVSRIAASRLLLPILLKNVDKILTLECDMLINDDISQLYETDLNNYVMACVEDFASVKHSIDIFGEKSDYYNTGVCLIDLKKLREINFLKILKDKIKENGYKYSMQEQDIWNDALRNKIKRLDIKWNFYHSYLGDRLAKIHQFVPKNIDEYNRAMKKPSIYHCVSEEKYWFPTVKKPYSAKYKYYASKSPFYKKVEMYNYILHNHRYKVLRFMNINLFEYCNGLDKEYLKILGIKIYKKWRKLSISSILKTIFSIQNTGNNTHKLIKILGVKFNIKKKSACNKQEERLRYILRDEVSNIVAREISQALAVQKLHLETFPQFKNININNDVAIIGCGPSIKYYNSEINAVNIALNKAIFIDNINFNYLFVWDYNGIIKKTPDFFETIKNHKCKKFYGHFLEDTMPSIPEFPDDNKNNIYHFYSSARHRLPAYSYGNVLHYDIETHPINDFQSISFGALQFALYTRPKRIYLIGLDTKNCGHYAGDNNTYNLKQMLLGYMKFKNHIKIHYPDVEIISVNPVGLKGMFKDVYTQSYVDAHPELLNEDIEILGEKIITDKEVLNV